MDDLLGAEWLSWKQHPKTQEFVSLMKLAAQDNKDNWVAGHFLSEDAHQTLVNTIFAQAGARQLEEVADLIENIKLDDEKERKDEQK